MNTYYYMKKKNLIGIWKRNDSTVSKQKKKMKKKNKEKDINLQPYVLMKQTKNK